MASSLFRSNTKPQASNTFQAAMAAAQELKHSNPEQLMEKMMEATRSLLHSSIKTRARIRRFGCNAVLSGNGVLLKGQGYFDVDAGVTFTPTAAGAYTATLFKDGVAVPGATQTVTAAAAGTVSVNIPAIVRNQCRDSTSTPTLVITSATVPATVTTGNTAVVVTKL